MKSTPTRLKAIEAAFQSHSPEKVLHEAHALKGVSANLGATKLSQLCSALSALAGASLLEPTGIDVFVQIKEEYAKVSREIQSLLKEVAATPQKPALVKGPETKTPTISSPNRKHVLIVDDDAFYRSLLTRTVAQVDRDAKVTTTDRYEEAVKLIKNGLTTDGSGDGSGFDLVIADLNLKTRETGLDIWSFCRVNLPKSRFLLLSGTPLDEFMALVDGQAGEAPSYLPKPFRLDQCRGLIAWMLRGKMKEAA
jgi:HPt (histidine-containing phosphotransfer) domain-containing protein